MKVGYGESREVGRTLTAIAKEVHLSGNPVNPPCAPIAGGGTGMGATGRIDSLLICGGGSTLGSTDREKTAASASASISSTKRSRQLHATMRQCDMWHPRNVTHSTIQQMCKCVRGTLGIGKPIRVSSKDPTHIAEGPGIDLGEFNDLPLLLEHFLTIDAEGGLRLCLESRRVDLPVAVPARSK